MSHAERVQKIVDRLRRSLCGYGGFTAIQIEDIITLASQIISEELP